MKQFLKFTFASVLGVILGLFLLGLIFLGIASASEKPVQVKENSILQIDLSSVSLERSNKDPFSNFSPLSMDLQENPGIYEVIRAIEVAKSHPKIKGIHLDLTLFPMGYASASEIRSALSDFKSSGKFVYAYSELYTQKSYYLATVADKVFLNPMGNIEFKGLGANIMFFTKALEQIGVEVQVIRQGKFKSAVEPFMLTEMSDANRLQTQRFLDGIWSDIKSSVAESRELTIESVQTYANRLTAFSADSALAINFVDGLIYQDQFLDSLSVASNIDSKPTFISPLTLLQAKSGKNISTDKIAIVFAQGNIVSGSAPEGTIGSERIAKAIRDARENEKVKAIVLRINSPGGSALASEVIWREIQACKGEKPVIASLGDYAASGGYYLACAADTILAHPSTITGSIGVFGLIPNLENLMKEKIGLAFDQVNTADMAGFGNFNRPLTEGETALLQNMVAHTYSTFLNRVAQGRPLTASEVDSIGQGRVWSGTDGKEIGLVDGFGTLKDAIQVAADKSGLDAYRLVEYPELKDPLQQLIQDLTGQASAQVLEEMPINSTYAKYIQDLNNLSNHTGVQAWMPYNFDLN